MGWAFDIAFIAWSKIGSLFDSNDFDHRRQKSSIIVLSVSSVGCWHIVVAVTPPCGVVCSRYTSLL